MKTLEKMTREELTAVRDAALKKYKQFSDQLDSINKEIKERDNDISPERAEQYRRGVALYLDDIQSGKRLQQLYTIASELWKHDKAERKPCV